MKSDRNRLLIVAVVLAVFLASLGTSVFLVSDALSQAYSPERALTDYFAAEARGDAKGMASNATFLHGDSSSAGMFGEKALVAMTAVKANQDLKSVQIRSARVIDDATRIVTVSMIWHGTQRTSTYTVRKDRTRVHYFVYHSWRVDIPYVTITLNLPLQPGPLLLDTLPVGSPASAPIQAIQGFHQVTMGGNFLYDSSTQLVDGSAGDASATFAEQLSAAASAAVVAGVKAGFSNCDPTMYLCYSHTYNSPGQAGYIYSITLPGYGDVTYSSYTVSMTSDPTATMTVLVSNQAGIVNVSGPCADTMTVDGSRKYNLKGKFTGALTWSNGAFVASLNWNCETSPA
ncbi:MAG: hypothetical protein ACHQ0J_01755 [Candidatus Dormibacterales bacterium]